MRIISRLQAAVRRFLITVAILALAGLAYTRTTHFQRLLEQRVIQAMEEAVGGRVTLDGFHFSLVSREVWMKGLTISSGEPHDPLLLRAGSVLVRVQLFAVLAGRLELRQVHIERPHIHLAVDEHGRSNVPRPPRPPDPRRSPLDPFFDLAIGRLEVVDGLWMWNDEVQRFSFTADDATASLNYDPSRDRYLGALGARLEKTPAPAFNLHFALARRNLEVTSLVVKTARSRISATGRLRDFRNPVAELSFQGQVDLADAGRRDLGGLIHGKGIWKYDSKAASWKAVGEGRFDRVRWQELPAISGSAAFEGTPQWWNLATLRANLLGGRADGALRVEWTEPPRYEWTGRFESLSLPLALETLAVVQPEWNVPKLRVLSSVSGEAEMAFRESLTVSARVALAAPGATPPGYVPLRGRASLEWDLAAARLSLHDTFLATPGAQVTAYGALGGGGSLRLGLEARQFAELAPLWTPPEGIEFRGPVALDGALSGPWRALVFRGRASVQAAAWQNMTIDRFTGNLLLSAERVEVDNGRLERGAASALVRGSAALRNGRLREDAPWQAALQLRQAEVADLQTLFDVRYPVRGQLDATAEVSGTPREPAVQGQAELSGGEIYGERLDRARAAYRFARGRLDVQDLVATRGRGRVTGAVRYESASRGYGVDLAGTALALADFPQIQSANLKWEGSLEFRLRGAGVWQEKGPPPTGQVSAQVRDLAVNGQPVGTIAANMHTEDDRLLVRLRSDIRQARADALGNVRLAEPYPFELRAEFNSLDLKPLLDPFLEGRLSVQGSGDGTATLHGDLRHWEQATASVEIQRVAVVLGSVPLRSQGVWKLRYRDAQWAIDELHLAGKDTDLKAAGVIGRANENNQRPLALRATGSLNVAMAAYLRPGWSGAGRLVMDARIEGSTANPVLDGRIDVQDVSLGHENFPNTLQHLSGALLFNRSGVRIEKLAGESGGGQVQLSGQFDYTRSPGTLQLRAEADGVRLRYPPGVNTTLAAALTWTGTTERSVLAGEISVVAAGISSTFDLAEALDQVRLVAAPPGEQSWAGNVDLALQVTSATDIRFESYRTRNLEAQLDLRVRGTLAEPGLLGRVNITQGQVNFAGNLYTINRGEISFLNPVRIDPVVSLDVSTRQQQYDISLDFSGPLERLRVNYRSDPPLPVADIQSLLLLGRNPTAGAQAAASNPARAQVGSDTILSRAMDSSVNSRVERFFGVSRLKIDPQAALPGENPTAKLTLEQQVARDVTFTYVTNLSNSQQQIVQLEWAVTRSLSVLAVRDQNGLFGIDFKYKKRFR